MAKRQQIVARSVGNVIEVVSMGAQGGAPGPEAEAGRPSDRQGPPAPGAAPVLAHPDIARIFAENSRLRADNMHLRGRLALLENRLGGAC